MDIRKLQRAIVDGLEDVKAQNIVVFNTEHLSPLFERVIIATGASNRQTKSLASSVRETVKKRGMQVMRSEGEDNGEWIIVDCGAAVVHVMQPAIREYYHLEEIWGGKSIKMTKAETGTRLVKASEDASEEISKAKKPAAKKTAAPAKKAAATKTAAPAKKTAAKPPAKKAAPAKAPAKKAAPAKRGVTTTTGVKKSPATTAKAKVITVGLPSKNAVARKAAADKAAPARRAAPAKKTAAATKAPAKTAAKTVTKKR